MKRLLLAGLSLITVTGSALGADLPAAYATKAPGSVYSWTGLYFGANLGGGFSSADDTNKLLNTGGATVLASPGASTGLGGVIGGGQLGYNLQAGHVLFGVEADFDGSGQTGTGNSAGATGTTLASHNENWFSTARGRIGWAADRWLFYVTGGAAFENLGHSTSFTPNGAANVPVGGETVTRTGYVVGGGIETGQWGNWTAGVEYLYIDTGNFNTSVTPSAAFLALPGNVALGVATAADSQRFQNSILRARLNLRF